MLKLQRLRIAYRFIAQALFEVRRKAKRRCLSPTGDRMTQSVEATWSSVCRNIKYLLLWFYDSFVQEYFDETLNVGLDDMGVRRKVILKLGDDLIHALAG